MTFTTVESEQETTNKVTKYKLVYQEVGFSRNKLTGNVLTITVTKQYITKVLI